MNLELGAPALDVAIGLAFVFFLLSLVSSAITEGIAWVSNQRAKTLEKGLKGMLGDDAFANTLLGHPLVKTDMSPAIADRKPSYLSPGNFALALVESLKAGGTGEDSLEKVKAGINATDGKLKNQLNPLLEISGNDLAKFRKAAENWFDDGMDRVSGTYKRWAQKIAVIAALVVAIGLNASAVRIAERLTADPTVRSAVVTGAQGAVTRSETSPKVTGEAAQDAVKELETLKIPILWSDDNSPVKSLGTFALALVGWLITAIALSLGAPFWFDALGKLAHLKTAGKKPEPVQQQT